MNEMSQKRVLVLQGGGALGSYQAGVYEALNGTGNTPDWVAGTSIGAINAALIAGNPPDRRADRLRQFWNDVTSAVPASPITANELVRSFANAWSAGWVSLFGIAKMFTPRLPPPFWAVPGGDAALSYYDTEPLRRTLERLVDFDRINSGEIRLSVGAVNIRTGNFVYFDNERQTIGPEHIMASGALPPGFPPVEIDGEAYWDGGLVSNTPLEHVLADDSVSDLLVFQVDLFSARGPMPMTLLDAAEREKDIRFSSRTRLNTNASLARHRAKDAVRKLLAKLPDELADDPEVRLLADMSRQHAVTIVQLIYRRKAYEGHVKDYEFSRQTMLDHWQAGIEDAQRSLRHRSEIFEAAASGEIRSLDLSRSPMG